MTQSFQPSLNLDVRQDSSLDDFDAIGYMPIVTAIHKLYENQLSELFIIGTKGSGKTHLALAIYNKYMQAGKHAISLSLDKIIGSDDDDVSVLFGLETFDLIILDDVQSVSKSDEWQEALFHLINRVREQHRQLIFLADNPARELQIKLLDLVTRLSLAPALKLPNGDDEQDRISIIQSILRRKNWRLPTEILNYLITEGPRNAADIIKVLDHISPLLTHLTRVQVPKKTIDEAKNIIERQTFLLEINNYISDDVNLD